MFVILTYDVKQERVAKICKICRKYLQHIQRSVFEGMITYGKLEKLKEEIKRNIDIKEDSIQIYKIEAVKYTSKEKIGIVKERDNII